MDYEAIPKLGFGLMRLPMCGEEVDIKQACRMADTFLEAGFKYFDTARGYIGGLSERAVQPMLSDRYPRDAFLLADKLSWWCVENGDKEAFFASQLERTGVEYFDFYLLHSMDRESLLKYDELDAWRFVAEKRRQGLVKNFGFSFHDTADVLDKILTDHPEVDFVQLQLNYNDWENEKVQSRLNYETVRRHGKHVVVMEPVKGGSLAVLPDEARRLINAASKGYTPAGMALRFAASLDGVITVLSGMSDEAQTADNIRTMSAFEPLNEKETDALAAVSEILNSAPTLPCTNCRYCTENCPTGIPIPDIIRGAFNSFTAFNNKPLAVSRYNGAVGGKARASQCVACGRCESVCPQKLPIIETLRKSAELFE